ncbi:MAG: enoyl-CoA hydratase/isomerase family protein [Sphingobium sp.]
MTKSPASDNMAAPKLVAERRDGDVVLVTLARPEAKNAVSFEMWRAFAELLDSLDHDTPARALVIHGADGFFSVGGDLRIQPAQGAGALALATRLEWGQRVIARLRRLPIPVIAAVEGGAYGVGWGLVLACDMIFASSSAKFGAPFVDFGLVPDGGSAWFLARQLGRHRAADLLFSGRSIDAEEALALGLVTRLHDPGTVTDAALTFAATIGKGNRHAVELTKRLLQTADGSDLDAAHALELAYCAILQDGEELARAREAFAARRKS